MRLGFDFADRCARSQIMFTHSLTYYLMRCRMVNLFSKDDIDEIQRNLVRVMKREMPKRPPRIRQDMSAFKLLGALEG